MQKIMTLAKKALKLHHVIIENGIFFSLILIFGKLKQIAFSKLIELSTSWRGVKIDGSFEIRGSKNINIGENFYAKHGLWLEAINRHNNSIFKPRIIIGNNFSCSVHAHISCAQQIDIGNDVLLGSNVLITDNNHGQYLGENSSDPSIPPAKRNLGGIINVTIGDRVWLCDDVKVLPGSNIGHGAIIGAGSIVNGIIPPNCIAIGRPAKPIKFFNHNSRNWISINESS